MNATKKPSEIKQLGRLLAAEYRAVFGVEPSLAYRRVGDSDALVVSDWLWLYQSYQPGGRWTVMLSMGHDWFFRHPCFARKDGYHAEKPSIDEAIVYLFQHEAHRLVHVHREGGVPCAR